MKRMTQKSGLCLLPVVVTLLLTIMSGCAADDSRAETTTGGNESGETDSPVTADLDTSDIVTNRPETDLADPATDTIQLPTADRPREEDEETLRSYYEGRLEELQQALMQERLDRYISEFEYKEKISSLQKELLLAGSGQELDTTIPVSGETDPAGEDTAKPSPEPIVKTDPDPDPDSGLMPTASYRYSIMNGEATIHEYLGGSGTVTVPSQIEGCPVVSIADGAFRGQDVTAVILPDTVESIGWFAFAGCVRLESVTLPRSVCAIAYAAFENCTHLTVLCERDSYAARWAESFGLSVQYLN